MLIIFWLLNIFNILKSCINVCVLCNYSLLCLYKNDAIYPTLVLFEQSKFHWLDIFLQIFWKYCIKKYCIIIIYGQLPIYRFYGNQFCWATARKCNSESANFTEDTIEMIRTALVFASFRKIVSCFGDFLHCSINKIYVQCRKI